MGRSSSGKFADGGHFTGRVATIYNKIAPFLINPYLFSAGMILLMNISLTGEERTFLAHTQGAFGDNMIISIRMFARNLGAGRS